jgi:TetR/AcrR family acrAB operon transcriptional repressor
MYSTTNAELFQFLTGKARAWASRRERSMVRKTKAEADATRHEIVDAARAVFHERGVSRTSLEQVAEAAGCTRGAIYWHFANKAALFHAVREQGLAELTAVDALLVAGDLENPLDAIEASLTAFIGRIEASEKLRRTFEIMSLRCEYVDEFAAVLHEVNKPCHDFLAKLRAVYALARERGFLREGCDAQALAYDTLSFTTGLFNNWLAAAPGDDLRVRAAELIRNHVALRRRGGEREQGQAQ